MLKSNYSSYKLDNLDNIDPIWAAVGLVVILAVWWLRWAMKD